MATIRLDLVSSGASGKGYAEINFNITYDAERNLSIVTFGDAFFSTGNIHANITSAHATVGVKAADTGKSAGFMIFEKTGVNSTGVSVPPRGKDIWVPHDRENPKKGIVMSVGAQLILQTSSGSTQATGDDTLTINTGVASIVHVGDKVGSLYVAKDGKWHIGALYASDDGEWHVGVGHVLSSVSGDEEEDQPGTVAVTYDDAGNVYLENVTVLYDGNGNVTMNGVNAVIDSDGNVTIT